MAYLIMPLIYFGFSFVLLCFLLFAHLSQSIPSTLVLFAAAYLMFGLALLWMNRLRRMLPTWTAAAAVVLAVVELCNVYLEQFVGLASPANAIVPASFMAAMVLTASVVAVLAAPSGIHCGVFSSVVTIGASMLMAVTIIIVTVRIRGGEPAAAEVLWNATVNNAITHLTLPLIVALFAGAVSAITSTFALSYGRRVCVLLSVTAVPLIVGGVAVLVRAAALPRSDRPPLVMLGMFTCAFAIAVLPSFLARKESARPMT
jgi:hypothetical protein